MGFSCCGLDSCCGLLIDFEGCYRCNLIVHCLLWIVCVVGLVLFVVLVVCYVDYLFLTVLIWDYWLPLDLFTLF